MVNVRKIGLFDIVNFLLLAFVAIACLFPFLHMASVTVSSAEHIVRNEISFFPRGFQLDTLNAVFEDPRLWVGYRNTLLYVSLYLPISMSLTIAAAYALSRRDLVFRTPVMLMLVFTLMFNGGMIPFYLVARSYGLIDTMWAVVLPNAINTIYVIIMRTFFQGLPKEIEESGRVDGLSDFTILTHVVLPLSKPVLLTIGLFYTVWIWNDFSAALLLLRDSSMFPLQLVIRNMVVVGQAGDVLEATTGGGTKVVLESLKYGVILLGCLPVIMVYPFIQKHFEQGALIGSVKG